MQIRIEGIKQPDGSELFDLVLVQGAQEIRLGLVVENETRAACELAVWLEEHTIEGRVDVVRKLNTGADFGKAVPA